MSFFSDSGVSAAFKCKPTMSLAKMVAGARADIAKVDNKAPKNPACSSTTNQVGSKLMINAAPANFGPS